MKLDIPLGALQSADTGNLYGAGRIVSSDEAAFAAVRLMGTCFATGHAAGVAAACQALDGTADIGRIREELIRQGGVHLSGRKKNDIRRNQRRN